MPLNPRIFPNPKNFRKSRKILCHVTLAPVVNTLGLFVWARLTGLARLPGRISPWVRMGKFSRFPRWEKAEDPRDEFWREIRKTKIDGETQPSYFFYAYHGFGNPFSCITAVKRVANDVENSSGRAKRCHSGRLVAEAKLFVTKVETNKAKMLEPKHSNVLV